MIKVLSANRVQFSLKLMLFWALLRLPSILDGEFLDASNSTLDNAQSLIIPLAILLAIRKRQVATTLLWLFRFVYGLGCIILAILPVFFRGMWGVDNIATQWLPLLLILICALLALFFGMQAPSEGDYANQSTTG